MALLRFVPAGTVHYWQAWVHLSIFTGALVLTTVYMRRDRALYLGGAGAEGWGAENGRSVNQAFIPSTLFPVEPTLRSAAGEPKRNAANLRQRAGNQTLKSYGSGWRQCEKSAATDSSGRAILKRRVISRVVHLSPLLWHRS